FTYIFFFRMDWIYQTFYFVFLFASVYSECMTQIYENTYFQGGDLLTVFTPSVEHCRIVCTYHPRCLLFTYLPANWKQDAARRFTCLLKDSYTEILPKLAMEGAISGHSLKQCYTLINACSKEVHPGLDMQGTNYNLTFTDSYQQCQKRCTSNDRCQFFTYATELFHSADFRNKCFLKYSMMGTPTRIRKLNNVVSGFSLKPCQLSEKDCRMDIFQRTVFAGDNITSVLAPDAQICRIICTYHQNCLFFTFLTNEWKVVKERNLCFLKTLESEMPTTFVLSGNAMSGFSLRNCRKFFPACHSRIHRDVNFLGDELNVAYVGGNKACQQLCTNTVRCQFFTYFPLPQSCNQEGKCTCHLRMSSDGNPTGIVYQTGKISGYSLRLCKTKTIHPCMQTAKLATRVVGGTASSPEEWPWQVSLQVRIHSWKHICGGSIISNQLILTAAHCTEGLQIPSLWRVYTGILNQSQITKGAPFFNVQEIIPHPQYEIAESGYDIALIKLDKPMNYTGFQQPICLPSKEETNITHTDCWVIGWGYTKEKGQIEDVLQKARIPLVSSKECQAKYQQYRIDNKMVCAGYKEGGKDAYSGGPLSCKYENTWYLVGVTSWGEGCARPEQPGVYTKVAEYANWIQENTRYWGLD
uniref:Coagulation factor XI n=1 Tax=Sphenodon punctatus TaxID=8508 RepID=A0A8D0HF36_SPHPU